MGFALTIALTLAAAGIFISLATETQVERFESDQAMAQAGRVSEFISNYNVETRDPAEPGTELQSIVQQAADISGLRITTFDAQGNVVADSNPPYISNPLESEGGPKEVEAVPLLSGGEVVGSLTASSDFAIDPEAQPPAGVGPEASSISRHVDRYLLWAGVGAAVLGTALVWMFARRTLAPVQRLGATARRLGWAGATCLSGPRSSAPPKSDIWLTASTPWPQSWKRRSAAAAASPPISLTN